MPLYNYKCPKGHEFEDFKSMNERHCAECPKCGKVANQTLSAPKVHKDHLGWFEHIAPEPVYVKSKKHLKELCNRYDCYAPGVLDG